MDEEKISLLDAKGLGKKLLDSWAYILLGLVLLLAVLSGYTNVDLNLLAAVNIGVDYAVLLVFCYASMFSLDAIAKKRGLEDQRYADAANRVEAVRTRLKAVDGELLQAFCEEYREEELLCTRRQILSEAMLTEKQFEAFVKDGTFPEGAPLVQRLALRRARRCKPVKLNRYMIGCPLAATYTRVTFVPPEHRMRTGSVMRALTTAVTVIFPVSISLSVILNPSLATFVAGLLKVFTVALAGFKAYHARIKNMTEDAPEYASIQEDITDRFEAWVKRKNHADKLAELPEEGSNKAE